MFLCRLIETTGPNPESTRSLGESPIPTDHPLAIKTRILDPVNADVRFSPACRTHYVVESTFDYEWSNVVETLALDVLEALICPL